jgi:hypothetical protein
MNALLTPYSSNCYFIQSREREYKIEVRLSRGARCIVSADAANWRDKIKMWWIALQVKATDLMWEQTEREYFECFELWKKGDEILEEYIADNPNEYWSIATQEALSNRNKTQKKLIFLGEMMLEFPVENSQEKIGNPFVNPEQIKAVVKMLRDDLEDNPSAYFQSLIQEEDNEHQGKLGFGQSGLQQKV